ncbi:AraC family transcriptional regulator [Paenibacillus radicis (ex Gao et al. 2016)]|uniref:AraC family transcriptional regulator n=1 Tax=Paenibacillus radicis (ex Gao et al. 2016) TaxID=1737354 RepID=A0A917H561_9BACL|nr:AraC family transcriptional regulator [Paenibacillus radicis (ex Gao et al. 2016)]GGG68006.1 AraC family transcriptional regulator [Paenibacillus radicis (ex Gao et al. 2016)]
MTDNRNMAIQQMVANMQVHIWEARKQQCWPEWRDIDYTPSYNKLYYILEGEGWLKIGDHELYPTPGQLILMPAHIQQSYSTISDKPFLKHWCHFSATVGNSDVFQWLDVPYCYDSLDPAIMKELFGQLSEANMQSSVTARLKEKSVLLDILSRIIELEPIHILQNKTDEMERLSVIQQYIENHLHEEVTVERMAAVLHLHPNYFIKYFKRHFGIPPLRYMNLKRMDKAKLMLQTTSSSIKEIALSTGFDDANYFSKIFRKEVGYSPSEYRSQL